MGFYSPLNDTPQSAFELPPQPSQTSCGPTCLHGIYRYFGDDVSLQSLIDEIPELEGGGGTLGVFLGQNALRRGYRAIFHSFNLRVFDPTWFKLERAPLIEKLTMRLNGVREKKLRLAIKAYREFLELGGELRFEDLNANLLRRYLKRDIPIISGLSATYLYQSQRENPLTCADDDIAGEPAGHFVVVHHYDPEERVAHIADPYLDNPLGKDQHYTVSLDRLINSILLGSYTYDANLLIIQPRA